MTELAIEQQKLIDEYKRKHKSNTLQAVIADIRECIKDASLKGQVRISHWEYSISVRVERAWTVDANLVVDFDGDKNGPGGITNWNLRPIKVGWSAIHRTLTESVAAIDLYREMVSLGCLIEDKFGKENIIALNDEEIIQHLEAGNS